LDIIFCSLYGFLDLIFLLFLTSLPLGPEGRGPTFNFALTMMIFGLFTKVSLSHSSLHDQLLKLAALYSSSHFFSAIGGAYSMESSMGQSAYDALGPAPSPNDS
jgi:hypothetical protein